MKACLAHWVVAPTVLPGCIMGCRQWCVMITAMQHLVWFLQAVSFLLLNLHFPSTGFLPVRTSTSIEHVQNHNHKWCDKSVSCQTRSIPECLGTTSHPVKHSGGLSELKGMRKAEIGDLTWSLSKVTQNLSFCINVVVKLTRKQHARKGCSVTLL